MWMAILKA